MKIVMTTYLSAKRLAAVDKFLCSKGFAPTTGSSLLSSVIYHLSKSLPEMGEMEAANYLLKRRICVGQIEKRLKEIEEERGEGEGEDRVAELKSLLSESLKNLNSELEFEPEIAKKINE